MQIEYNATKTASEFHADNSFVRLMLGPVGCGKSVADCVEVFRRALQQAPGSNGVRQARWAITRNTYPELKETTIKTWKTWFPENIYGKIKWDSPISHSIFLKDFQLEVIFLSLDNPEEAIRKLKSFELTGIYFNELQFVHKKVFEEGLERVDRYPSKMTGAPLTWTGCIADTNPPSTNHWIYKTFEQNRPDNYKIFKYEPALLQLEDAPSDGTPYAVSLEGSIWINNPAADYVWIQSNPNYWLKLVAGKSDSVIKVSYCGEYGLITYGKPVHPEYRDSLHYVDKVFKYDPELELGIGIDFGLTPSFIILQPTPRGQLLVLKELCCEGMGLRDACETVLLPYLSAYCQGWHDNYRSRHDPAGNSGSQTDGKNCQQILSEFGIESYPAASDNSPTPRREGLKYHLRRLVDGQAAILFSRECQMVREGLAGQFQYAKIRVIEVEGSNRYHEKPLKNEYSHPCEALEYIAMSYALPSQAKNTAQNDAVNKLARYNSQVQALKRRAYATS